MMHEILVSLEARETLTLVLRSCLMSWPMGTKIFFLRFLQNTVLFLITVRYLLQTEPSAIALLYMLCRKVFMF